MCSADAGAVTAWHLQQASKPPVVVVVAVAVAVAAAVAPAALRSGLAASAQPQVCPLEEKGRSKLRRAHGLLHLSAA